jgi:hypothetical protein
MTYFTPRPSGENSGRRRYGFICAFSSGLLGIVGLIVYIAGSRIAGVYTLGSASVFMIVASELRFPGFAIFFALIMAPIFALLQGAHDNREIWRTWQYWVAAAICASAGLTGLVWLNRKYGKPPHEDIT